MSDIIEFPKPKPRKKGFAESLLIEPVEDFAGSLRIKPRKQSKEEPKAPSSGNGSGGSFSHMRWSDIKPEDAIKVCLLLEELHGAFQSLRKLQID